MTVVRFGVGALEELPDLLAELGRSRPLVVTTRRGSASLGPSLGPAVFDAVEPHVPAETVRALADRARREGADALVAVGGGSAIDTCKAAVAELVGHGSAPVVVAVPTTYAGAEWTPFFGVLLGPGRKGGGSHPNAVPVAAIYDPALTLDLPLEATVGTAMNALAHCAEAYYHPDASERAARHADTGATAIGYALPLVVRRPDDLYARTRLLEGAMRAARALAESGLCLAHALAQAVGGRYGVPQGAANACCLPVALRFNAAVVPDAIARFGAALGADDAASRCTELAALAGLGRLRDLGIPGDGLRELAAAAAERPGTRANPRPAGVAELEALYREAW